jgi:hypothetical protein
MNYIEMHYFKRKQPNQKEQLKDVFLITTS